MAFNNKQFLFSKHKDIEKFPTLVDEFKNPKKQVKKRVAELSEFQERLYADNRYSLLLIFQGMDTAGKDSTIKNVISGVNPQGFQVHNYKQPTYRELDYSFLWRHWRDLPQRGRIGIFNRSYYEEVLVVKVHPGIVQGSQLPNKKVNDEFWQQRYDDINSMEEHLASNGTKIIKFFLNVSKEQQRLRLIRRLDRTDKHWKFSFSDIKERGHWDDYRHAYQETLMNTHTKRAPWYVVPADHKWTMRAIIANILVHEVSEIPALFPAVDTEEAERFAEARAILESQAP